MSTKVKYKSVSITEENYNDLMAIAAGLADTIGIPVSANSAISVLIKKYTESENLL